MKIVNIFGLVVGIHVAVLLLIFAIPGCRTTSKAPAVAPAISSAPVPMTEPSPIQPAPDTMAALNPPVAEMSAGSTAMSSGTRQSPTRPGAAPAPTPTAAIPPPTTTYTVVRGDSLWSVAKKHGVTRTELAAANRISPDASLKIDQTLVIPAPSATPAPSNATSSAAAASASGDATNYVVRSGDTLGAIARRHRTTVAAIKAMNNLRGDMVRIGDLLLIPASQPAATAAPAASSSTPTANPSTPAPTPALARGANGTMKHVVAPGETLGSIARRYGTTVGDIGAANNIPDPTKIRPGQELVIPGAAAPAAAIPKAPVPTQYPPSYQPTPPTDTPPPATPNEDVPVIQVEEPVPTLRIDSAPPSGGSNPPLFN
ncbi:MAG TPA: LysM peptidoglycan-binding domain-containing protein [Candidatus Synoicihabitans sp.]|nr:LysM peptidoglycan-binding domain-containing protein [Candidatus Synoicihabitans sp.]